MHATEKVLTDMVRRLRESLPTLRTEPEEERLSYFRLYFERLTELVDGAVRLIGQTDNWAPASVLLRSALECTADLKNLACAPGYEHVVRAMMLENRSAVYHYRSQPAYGELLAHYGREAVEEQGARAKRAFQEALEQATAYFPELRASSRNLTVINRFRIAQMEESYQTEYTLLSMVSHNDVSVLALGDVMEHLPGVGDFWEEYAYGLCLRFIVEAVKYRCALFGREDELVRALLSDLEILRERQERKKKSAQKEKEKIGQGACGKA